MCSRIFGLPLSLAAGSKATPLVGHDCRAKVEKKGMLAGLGRPEAAPEASRLRHGTV